MSRPPAAVAADHMADAARAFVDTLDADQRALAAWAFPADDERRRWFYTPTDHGGITLGQLTPAQQRLAMRLVRTGLSRAGYVTVSAILGLENVLDELEGWRIGFHHERGRDPGRYYLRVFGEPGGDAWSWRIGGHHVSIHHTVLGGEVVSSTPCFLGADPASAPLLGPHPLRPLGGVEDLGRELVRSLDHGQRAAAIISAVAPTDIVGANRSRVGDGDLPLPLTDVWRGTFGDETDELLASMQAATEAKLGLEPEHLEALRLTAGPKGVAASSLSGDQQAMLRALLELYLHRLPDELADREAAKLDPVRFAAVHFAWAGGLEPGQPHYYRVQGPRLLVEYDNTARDANHVHSVWRDPEGDFGDDVLGQHLRQHHGRR